MDEMLLENVRPIKLYGIWHKFICHLVEAAELDTKMDRLCDFHLYSKNMTKTTQRKRNMI